MLIFIRLHLFNHLNLLHKLNLRFIPTLILSIGLVAVSLAQVVPPEARPDSALNEALLRVEGEPLSLEEVVSAAIQQSTLAHDARAALASARGSLTQQRGRFDPELFGEIMKSDEKLPTASPFSGAAVLHPVATRGEAGARMRLPIGTELSASVTGQKLETNSAYASLNPEYNATGNLTFVQPLLHGFGPAGWGDYWQAKVGYDAAKYRYDNAIAGIATLAESMNWDLYAAERDLAVAQLTAEQADALYGEADTRAKAGLIGPNQLNNAKVFQAEQQLAFMDANESLSRASDALASLINRRPDASSLRYRTMNEPPVISASEPMDSTLARAMRTNRELKAAEKDVEGMRALYRAARWNAFPQADLFGALGGNGLGGTGRDVIFGSDTLRNNMDTGFSDAVDQAIGRDYPTWMIGIRLSIPILLRENGGARDRMRAEMTRAEQRYVQTRHNLEEQVRASHRDLETGRERMQISEAGVQAARDQVRIGRIEFENGRTPAFELVRLGADLANAQRRYSQALVRTAKAAARLRQLAPIDSENGDR